MGRKRVDHNRVSGRLKTTTVTLDLGVMPFIKAMSDDGKVSSGVRACIRAAIYHQTKHGRLPPGYVKHIVAYDYKAADGYLALYPDQAPEGYQRRTILNVDEAFAGWDDPDPPVTTESGVNAVIYEDDEP